jgi:hypothetical protein
MQPHEDNNVMHVRSYFRADLDVCHTCCELSEVLYLSACHIVSWFLSHLGRKQGSLRFAFRMLQRRCVYYRRCRRVVCLYRLFGSKVFEIWQPVLIIVFV